jgi:hypothetical protein
MKKYKTNRTYRVRTRSGMIGYRCLLRASYDSFDQFEAFSDTYGLASRLGFRSASAAWNTNPVIEGSTNPEDFRVVIR